jgi:hypothetical protein
MSLPAPTSRPEPIYFENLSALYIGNVLVLLPFAIHLAFPEQLSGEYSLASGNRTISKHPADSTILISELNIPGNLHRRKMSDDADYPDVLYDADIPEPLLLSILTFQNSIPLITIGQKLSMSSRNFL